jgi:hypothetical protein
MSFGVVCLVCGKERHGWGSHVSELGLCLDTFREHHPDIPVTVWSDDTEQPWPTRDIRDVWEIVPAPARVRHGQHLKDIHGWKVAIGFKIMAMLESPYDQTLWLDGDTVILDHLGSIFDDKFDIAMAYDYDNKGVVETLYNSGVVALRKNPATNAFLQQVWDQWFQANTRFTEQDVMYKLLKGAHKTLKFKRLDHEVWNVRPALANAMPQEKRGDVRILHSRGHRLLDPPKYWEQYR